MSPSKSRTNLLAISQLSTLRWTMDEDVVAYANRGFDGIGLYRPKLDDYGVDRTALLLAEHQLHPTSLSWVGGFTGSDVLGIDDAICDAIDAVRDAAHLQVETLIVLTGGRNNHIRSHIRRTLCDALRDIADAAESFGVRLSIEPFHPGCGDEWSFVHDLRAALEIIETVGTPNLGLTLDTYHVGMDADMLLWLPDVVEHLQLVQFGDGRHSPMGEMNRCLLGDGCIPLREIYEALLEHDYAGPIEVELLGEDIESVSYDSVLDHAREFFGSLDSRLVSG